MNSAFLPLSKFQPFLRTCEIKWKRKYISRRGTRLSRLTQRPGTFT